MDFNRQNWTEQSYQELLDHLNSLADLEYRKFTHKLIPETDNLLGVRSPELRKISKEIAKGNAEEYLHFAGNRFHEETLLHGMVIGELRCDFAQLKLHIANFVPKINNWAVCDSFCSGLKVFEKNLSDGFAFLHDYVLSNSPWEIRFGLISMLSYYLIDEYIDAVLGYSGQVTDGHYYVKMGNAWLISVAFVKFRDKTVSFFNNCPLDDWTYNKALQKIIESNRVDADTKKLIKTLKR